MVKRTGATQDVLDHSAKRSRIINILSSDEESDSEPEPPELDFMRATRSSQKTRQTAQSAGRTRPRDSGYHTCSQLAEAEAEAEVDKEEILPSVNVTRNYRKISGIDRLTTPTRSKLANTHATSTSQLRGQGGECSLLELDQPFAQAPSVTSIVMPDLHKSTTRLSAKLQH
jgi:hypothetical protein